MNIQPEQEQAPSERWTLMRDVAVLQAKLIVDGLRDLVLVPASIIAGIISLASGTDGRPGSQFYQLLALGKQSERWINLFGALQNAPPDLKQMEPFPDADMDELVGKLETFVRDEGSRGEVTNQAKDRLEKVLNALNRGRHGPT